MPASPLLPPALQLRTLNLAQNELSGTLPPFNTPRSWRSLKTLDLSENGFYGKRTSLAL